MGSAPPPGTAAALLAILGDGAAGPERQLRTLVTTIDLAVAREPEHGLAAQALARAVAAVGLPLLARHPDGPQSPRISATLAAAEAYARDPDDRTERALYECATDSYPFGPGEGHYGTTERDGCEPGSGCRSGAGTLLFAARETGFAEAIDTLTAELSPWLRASQARPELPGPVGDWPDGGHDRDVCPGVGGPDTRARAGHDVRDPQWPGRPPARGGGGPRCGGGRAGLGSRRRFRRSGPAAALGPGLRDRPPGRGGLPDRARTAHPVGVTPPDRPPDDIRDADGRYAAGQPPPGGRSPRARASTCSTPRPACST